MEYVTRHNAEDAWFKRREMDLINIARPKSKAEVEDEASAAARKLCKSRYMLCPKCGRKMNEIHIQALVADECTACQGIFIDSRELTLLLEKSVEEQRDFFQRLAGNLIPVM